MASDDPLRQPPARPTNGNGHKNGAAPRAHRLSHIARMLSRTPEVRSELVADIQQQLDDGTYLTEEKLDLAIYRMLKDILA